MHKKAYFNDVTRGYLVIFGHAPLEKTVCVNDIVSCLKRLLEVPLRVVHL